MNIRLNGAPRDSIPQLHSPDAVEQVCLANHHFLMDRLNTPQPFRSLSRRWTNVVAGYFDILVPQVNRTVNPMSTIDSLVQTQLQEHQESRGKAASALAKAAVCQAVLDLRSEYLEEFTNPNPPVFN